MNDTIRKQPRCPVAEFAHHKDDLAYQARVRHPRDYQLAKAEGRPLPDLFDYLPPAEELPCTAFEYSWLQK